MASVLFNTQVSEFGAPRTDTQYVIMIHDLK
jgi:hypothetical protein